MQAVNLAHQILEGKLEDLPDMGEARITWIAYPKKDISGNVLMATSGRGCHEEIQVG